jgi:hypothetical protein
MAYALNINRIVTQCYGRPRFVRSGCGQVPKSGHGVVTHIQARLL